MHELEIALATDTSLAPEQVPDPLWFETESAKLLEEIAAELGERKDHACLAQLAVTLHRTMDVFGRYAAVAEGLLVARIAGTPILHYCRQVDLIPIPRRRVSAPDKPLFMRGLSDLPKLDLFRQLLRKHLLGR